MLDIFNRKTWRHDIDRKDQFIRILAMEDEFYPAPGKRAVEVMDRICDHTQMPPEQIAEVIEALFVMRYDKAMKLFEHLNIVNIRNRGEHLFDVLEGVICGLVRAAIRVNGAPANKNFDIMLPKFLAQLLTHFARAVYIVAENGKEPRQKLGGAFANDISAYLSAKDWPRDPAGEANRRCQMMMDYLAAQDWSIVKGAPLTMFNDIMHKALACVSPNRMVHALRSYFRGEPGGFTDRNLIRSYAAVEGVHLERLNEEQNSTTLCFASKEDAESFIEYCRLAHFLGDVNGSVNGIDKRFAYMKLIECASVPDVLYGVYVVSQLEQRDVARLLSWVTVLCKRWNAEVSKMPVPEFGWLHGAITFKWDKPKSLQLPKPKA
jgi:hypothetical protein